MGDLAWDTYWYEKNFFLDDYLKELRSLNCPIFNAPGNHDNDPKVINDDFVAATPFRTIVGPTYFSFNLGEVHYILLDNVEYLNPGGLDADHMYNKTITTEQLEWLRRDLQFIEKSTPIVVGMHIPLHNSPKIEGIDTPIKYNLSNGEELLKCLDGYMNVHILTGHTHRNYNVVRTDGLREHNIAAVCATWWWTGHTDFAGNHICQDGSPGGYKIFDIDGTSITWHYKGIGEPDNYQFRTYDLNECHIRKEDYCPAASDKDFLKYVHNYNEPGTDNGILINIFDWNEDWELTITDTATGQVLEWERIEGRDPLHIISYNMQKLRKNQVMTFPTSATTHLFRAQASSPSSTLKIEATDGFGKRYSQEMTRPKPLSFDCK